MSIALPVEFLRKQAFKFIEGVGDASLGQWEEYTGYAFHLRRRLSSDEQIAIGDVVDIRDTDEQERRWLKVRQHLPEQHRDFKG